MLTLMQYLLNTLKTEKRGNKVKLNKEQIEEIKEWVIAILIILLVVTGFLLLCPIQGKASTVSSQELKKYENDSYVLYCQPNEKVTISFDKGRNIPCTNNAECDKDV